MCCREQAAQAAANEAKAAGEEPPAIAPLFSGYSLTKEHSLGDTHCHPQPAERHLAGTPRRAARAPQRASNKTTGPLWWIRAAFCLLTRVRLFAVRA